MTVTIKPTTPSTPAPKPSKPSFWDSLTGGVTDAIDGVADTVQDMIIQPIGGALKPVTDQLSGALKPVVDTVQDALEPIAGAVGYNPHLKPTVHSGKIDVSGIIKPVIDVVAPVPSLIHSFMTGTPNTLLDTASGAADSIAAAIGPVFDAVPWTSGGGSSTSGDGPPLDGEQDIGPIESVDLEDDEQVPVSAQEPDMVILAVIIGTVVIVGAGITFAFASEGKRRY